MGNLGPCLFKVYVKDSFFMGQRVHDSMSVSRMETAESTQQELTFLSFRESVSRLKQSQQNKVCSFIVRDEVQSCGRGDNW